MGNLNNEDEVRALVQSIVEEENVGNYELKISAGSEKGDGYVSYVTGVEILGENKNLYVIIKNAPKEEAKEFRAIMLARELFLREIFFYDKIYPAFRDFQRKNNVKKPFDNVCRMYKSIDTDCNEKLVLQNIRKDGYDLWNRLKQMDHAHVQLVFETYAKLHSTSYMLRDKKPDVYKSLLLDYTDLLSELMLGNMVKTTLSEVLKLVVKLFESEKNIANAVQKLQDEYEDYINLMKIKGKNSVIGHGDCWSNNMMFKYEDSANPETPTSIYLLDFQISCLISPVQDLSYFFYVSATKEMKDNLDKYLRIYLNAFNDHVRALGGNPENYFTWESLKQEWKKYCKCGYLLACIVFKMILRSKEETADLISSASEEAMKQAVLVNNLSDDISASRLKELTRHMYENDFL